MSSSTVTYTSVYTDSKPGRPVAPPFPDYVPGPEHPLSLEYVPGPEHPPSPVDVPYVPEPKYPEYLAPSDAEVPLEDQPLPADASPTALSPGYMADSDQYEDPEEDPKEDHTDYPANGGDGNDEPSNDNDDTDDEDEEPFEDEDDNEEEEEHLAPTDSYAIPIVDPIPSVGDTEAFKTDESVPTPRSPQTKVPFAQTHLHRARKTVRIEPPMSASIKARAPLGYRAVGIRIRATSSPLLLPYTSHRTDIPEAEMQPQKRAYLNTLTPRLEIRENLAACAARQLGTTLEADLRRDRVIETGYGITDTWDEIAEAMLEVAPITLEGVNQRVTKLATTVRQENEESQTQLTTTLGRIETLKARDLEPQDEPVEAGSSC
ncbi:hypothetical protein Tco_0661456 [Tanacetum coccineum]